MKTIALALVLAGGTAAADPELHDVVSTQLATVALHAVNVQLDHDLGAHRLSLATAFGVRTAAMGDFESWTYGVGAELRRWKSRVLRGWYAGVRADTAVTHVTDDMQHASLGNTVTFSTGVTGGYRFVLWGRGELTPSLGIEELFERTPMQPVATRPVVVVGLTAGAVL
jgi:hypothetical protein